MTKTESPELGSDVPDPIDLKNGRILTTPNLGWDDVDVQSYLEKRFGCPTVVVNDVDAGVFGEYMFGSAKGSRCAVGIFPGTGIGGGCVYKGRILHGAGISCMEIGHTRISSSSRASGYKLAGTVEAEASRLTIAAEAAKAAYRGDAPYLLKKTGTDLSAIRSSAIADAVANGDKVIRNLVEEAAEAIGVAVVNVVHILAPDVIVLGGGLVEAMEDLIVGTVRKTARQSVMSVYRDRFRGGCRETRRRCRCARCRRLGKARDHHADRRVSTEVRKVIAARQSDHGSGQNCFQSELLGVGS